MGPWHRVHNWRGVGRSLQWVVSRPRPSAVLLTTCQAHDIQDVWHLDRKRHLAEASRCHRQARLGHAHGHQLPTLAPAVAGYPG